jgi:ABC-type multidrug transport system fused ATPase/permease subunit
MPLFTIDRRSSSTSFRTTGPTIAAAVAKHTTTHQQGDITSRLSADCTKVGDQVSLNVNFFLRNFVQAVGTLLFMFYLSWKLSVVAFVSVPLIVIISKYYGEYIRELSKQTQDKLAHANTVAEEVSSCSSSSSSFASSIIRVVV